MLVRQIYKFDGTNIPLWVHTLFWGVYVLVFLYSFRMIFFSPRTWKPQKHFSYLFISFFSLFAIFYCIGDDYFNYREWIYGRNFEFWSKEKVYVGIVFLCRFLPVSYPYEFFRLIVWGGAIMMAYYTFRMYRKLLMPGMVLLLLFIFYSNAFCYARASLGMAVFFLGVGLFLRQKQKRFKYLGIVIAMSSVLFHREMLVGIAILPSLFIPLEKKVNTYLVISLLLFVILGISLIDLDFKFFDAIFDSDTLSNKLERFKNAEEGAFRLSTLVKYLNYFYPFFIVTGLFWNNKIPHSIAGIYRITYSILLISVAFMMVFGLRSVYTYRVMYISMIPLVILTGFCYNKGYLKKNQFLIMMTLAFLSNSVRFINA